MRTLVFYAIAMILFSILALIAFLDTGAPDLAIGALTGYLILCTVTLLVAFRVHYGDLKRERASLNSRLINIQRQLKATLVDLNCDDLAEWCDNDDTLLDRVLRQLRNDEEDLRDWRLYGEWKGPEPLDQLEEAVKDDKETAKGSVGKGALSWD